MKTFSSVVLRVLKQTDDEKKNKNPEKRKKQNKYMTVKNLVWAVYFFSQRERKN
jgi:hypothetical protein